MFLGLFEILFFIIGIWFITTQMIFPAIRNTKMFPIFRKEAQLKETLTEINQQIREKKLEKVIEQTKKELDPAVEETKNQ